MEDWINEILKNKDEKSARNYFDFIYNKCWYVTAI